jgi:poly(hydroxyalkanoate) granule-associated protein
MARKTRTTRTTRKAKLNRFNPVNAFAMARASATNAVDAIVKQGAALVKQGVALEAASRKAAIDRATAAKDSALAVAGEAKAKTVEAVSHLEKVFEQRVSKVISKMGVPTTKDVRSLSRQVAQLQASVDRLNRSRSRASA